MPLFVRRRPVSQVARGSANVLSRTVTVRQKLLFEFSNPLGLPPVCSVPGSASMQCLCPMQCLSSQCSALTFHRVACLRFARRVRLAGLLTNRYKYNYKWPLVFTFKLVAKPEHLIWFRKVCQTRLFAKVSRSEEVDFTWSAFDSNRDSFQPTDSKLEFLTTLLVCSKKL